MIQKINRMQALLIIMTKMCTNCFPDSSIPRCISDLMPEKNPKTLKSPNFNLRKKSFKKGAQTVFQTLRSSGVFPTWRQAGSGGSIHGGRAFQIGWAVHGGWPVQGGRSRHGWWQLNLVLCPSWVAVFWRKSRYQVTRRHVRLPQTAAQFHREKYTTLNRKLLRKNSKFIIKERRLRWFGHVSQMDDE